MKLIYKQPFGKLVQIGDKVTLTGHEMTVESFEKPHKPDASGRVVVTDGANSNRYYVSVIGAEWIEREDRDPEPDTASQH